jgi:hypothetical protein
VIVAVFIITLYTFFASYSLLAEFTRHQRSLWGSQLRQRGVESKILSDGMAQWGPPASEVIAGLFVIFHRPFLQVGPIRFFAGLVGKLRRVAEHSLPLVFSHFPFHTVFA